MSGVEESWVDRARRYGLAVAAATTTAAVRLLLDPWLGETAPYALFFVAIAAAAWYGGLGPGLLATVLSMAFAVFMFVEPRGSFALDARSAPGLPPILITCLLLVLLGDSNRRARGRAERSAREAARERERLRVTLSSLGDGVIAADTTGLVTFLNPAAETLTGWREAEAVGREFAEVFASADEASGKLLSLEAALTTQEGRVTAALLRARDGTLRPIEESVTPLRGASGEVAGAVVVFRDLSNLRRATRALSKSEATYRILSDGLEQMVWTARPDGRVEYTNQFLRDYTGLSLSEIQARGWDVVHPDDRHRARSDWDEAVRDGVGYEFEQRFHRASDGAYRWHLGRVRPVSDAEGRVVRWLGTAIDIEDRRRSVEALRVSEERLRLAQEAARMGTWDFDVANQTVVWSPNLEALHGLPPGTFAGTFDAYQRDIHPDDRDRVLTSVRRAIDEGVPHHVEYRILWPDRSVHWIEARGQPLTDAGGRVYRMIGNCMDVTERKRTEVELRRALDLAEEAGRAKDRFLAMLSHELRTPLSPVLLVVDELGADPALAQVHRETLEAVRRNVELEVRLIDDLLDVTRVVHGKLPYRFEPVDVHDLLRQTLEICRTDVEAKRIDLEVAVEAPRRHVSADPARLQQVLWNLVKNAVKFTPEGGAVRVRTWNEGSPDCLLVEVSDTGLGIDPAALPRIFRAFEQAEDAVTRGLGGLGLGLAIRRAIVESHGGTLTAESAGRGQGSTFRLSLPTVPAPTAESRTALPAASCESPPSPRLLLVEDDPLTARIMARLLRSNGYTVIAANTLADARAVPIDEIDLVVSDLSLPDGNGLDLMRDLASRVDVPGIALTGYGMEDDIRRCREAGFVAHLTKPVDFSRLDAVIRRVAAEFPRHNDQAAATGPRAS
jgi:PAS domain S-box-containing protein